MRYKIIPYSLAWLIKTLKDNIKAGLIGAGIVILIAYSVILIGGLV